jgi:hypothetical protein
MFEADGQPHQALADAGRLALVLGERPVGGGGRMAD